MASRIPLMAGNWKMNLTHPEAVALVQKLAWILADKKHDYARTEVVVVPPFTDLRSVQTLVDGDRLVDPVRRPGRLRARLRRLHRRDLGDDAGQARLLLRRGRALRAPASTTRRPTTTVNAKARQAVVGRDDADRLRRRGARRTQGRRAGAVHAGPGRRLAGRVQADRRSPRWWSPTSRSGRSAPARSRRPRTPRRCARRSAARLRETAGDDAADGCRILYGGSVKAAQHRRDHGPARRRRRPRRRREPAGRGVRRDLPVLRHAHPVTAAWRAAGTWSRPLCGPVRDARKRDVGYVARDHRLHHSARHHQLFAGGCSSCSTRAAAAGCPTCSAAVCPARSGDRLWRSATWIGSPSVSGPSGSLASSPWACCRPTPN